jgi:predicted fused transcriptional regulator/phosphomethylpyrimidine kinase
LKLRELVLSGYSFPRTDDPTSKALEEKLESAKLEFDVVIDTGGEGIEPNVYLFSTGARELAELALRIARLYSAG